MAEFDPLKDAPLQPGERVRIVDAPSAGGNLMPLGRFDGCCATVQAVHESRYADGVIVTIRVSLDERRPQRPGRRSSLELDLRVRWDTKPRSCDRIERLPAAAVEEVAHG